MRKYVIHYKKTMEGTCQVTAECEEQALELTYSGDVYEWHEVDAEIEFVEDIGREGYDDYDEGEVAEIMES